MHFVAFRLGQVREEGDNREFERDGNGNYFWEKFVEEKFLPIKDVII